MTRKDVPEPWHSAMIAKGGVLLDPRTGKPSAQGLARAADISPAVAAHILKGEYNPKSPDPRIVESIAAALGKTNKTVAKWLGQTWATNLPYVPPAEASVMTLKQRRLVNDLIRMFAAQTLSSAEIDAQADSVVLPLPTRRGVRRKD